MKLTAIFATFVLGLFVAGCSSEETGVSTDPVAEINGQETVTDPGVATDTTPTPDAEGIQLRYRFEEGQRLDYIMSTEIDADIINLKQQTKTNLDFYFHVTVDTVEADGSAVITQINDRVKYKVKGPGGTILYDSADGEESDHPQWQGIRVAILPMRYAQSTFRVTATGGISDVQPTAELAERLEKDPSMAAVITQDQLERNAFTLFHPMPEAPVESGATWNYLRTVEMGAFKFEFNFTKTFEGAEDHEGRQVLNITETVVSKKTGEPTPAFDYNVNDELTAGQEYFDPKMGWLVSMNDVTVATMKQMVMGLAIETENTQKVSIQLQPAVQVQPESESDSE